MSAKAIEQCREIRTDLAGRFATVGGVEFDVNGMPYFLVGTGVAGTQSATVKVQDYRIAGSLDIIGHPQTGYGNPVLVQVCEESGILTAVSKLALLATLGLRGAKIETYVVAAGVAPLNAGIIPANLVASWSPVRKYGLMMSM
jgi:hypothetical protein